MSKRVREWRSWSRVAQVDFYTRLTVCAVPFLFPLTNGAQLLNGSRPLGWLLLGISVVHCAHHVTLARRCLDHYLWKRPAPWWGLVVSAVLFLAFMCVFVAKVWAEGLSYITTSAMMLQAGGLIVFGSFSTLVRIPRYLAVCAAAAVLVSGSVILMGGQLLGALVVGAFMVFTGVWSLTVMRTSAWILSVLWELETARTAQARLAVAEERLRFSRDMHDVMGRNLAVIALKSELAVQLAQRGSPAALEQMAEVQRLAQDSQREVREVVRGYREADLRTELVGARGVLSAAGIECRIDDAAGRELPAPVQSALAWVVREATTNVLRHADAGRCAVRMRIVDDAAVLVMENDGVADRSPGAGTGSGSGLAGLRERLDALGGTITAERRGAKMFRVTAEVPLAGGEALRRDTAGDGSVPEGGGSSPGGAGEGVGDGGGVPPRVATGVGHGGAA
ncbi:sensor histidine kinase [Streptomyces blastmyceticus]|uniref:Histidine kinase n=1 Tax=Streptomyces blastmyceticus TaxID=68180 RepID=A0ABN0WZ69_9ACTN